MPVAPTASSRSDRPAAAPASPAVRAAGVHVDLGGRPVLRGVDLVALPGEMTAIVGPNGAGKSTLLAVLAGLLQPHAGRVEHADAASIAFVPQRTALSDRLPITVGELVAMGRWQHAGFWRPLSRADRAIVADALDTVGMAPLHRRPVAELSGGQRQRALIAQGLAQQARLLLLDEPMASLDASARDAVADAISCATAAGTAVVAVTHDLDALPPAGSIVRLAPPEGDH
ncbi:zinc ABC transporter ATP-binding protein AztA [Agromyces albus]|uniref:zinc ABC transporter ATP-binding protein AztA n=1 Tax=Agromyces albus TaxID=205332 RepID=UPI0019D6C9BF|nr:zinc ABC transporter ATP-binding protein AztA [Agromyces albus]